MEAEKVERFFPDDAVGLLPKQVQIRREQGLVNGQNDIPTKTVGQIVKGNLLTLFNLLNFFLAVLVLAVGSYKNALFMGVILCNICIGTFQEIRAKKIIDRLSLISTPKVHVVRNGNVVDVGTHDLVLDDIMFLKTGNQICSDSVITSGSCEVNESLITGESDPVMKSVGDSLLSGSFIVSGHCRARVEHIGSENYAYQISSGAKFIKKPNSQIMKSINLIIKWISFVLLPLGLLLFYNQITISHQSTEQAIVGTVAALVGMIPEGLVLLTSVVLAVSVIRLSRQKTLVQELYCIETLARVDVLCLDKTGTITEGSIQVDELQLLAGVDKEKAYLLAGAFCGVMGRENPTSVALSAYFTERPQYSCIAQAAFSSARKWSGASFQNQGTVVVGAPEFVLKKGFPQVLKQAEQAEKNGQRVVVLAYSKQILQQNELPEELCPLALVLMSDKVRGTAPQTLRYFEEQGVQLKVISGDSVETVANVARRAGLRDWENKVDASMLRDEELSDAIGRYSVFGRVSPQQKLSFIKSLKAEGHTVAMTGDGVNDVLALKEADCSIAMASGSDAARTVSQLVLLDSNFASMPKVLAEGRRSINNIQRSASLFLVKTIYAIILGVMFAIIDSPYPFMPIQLTLLSSLTIGVPSFILALEPNKELVRGNFLFNVIQKAIPGALTIVFNVVILQAIADFFTFTPEQISTMTVVAVGVVGFMVLFKVCLPFNLLRSILMATMMAGFVLAVVFFKGLFSLTSITFPMAAVLVALGFASFGVMLLVLAGIQKIARLRERRCV